MVTFAQGLSIADILGTDEGVEESFDQLKNEQAEAIEMTLPKPQPSDPIAQRCIQLFVKNQARHSLKKAYKRELKGVQYGF